jgi:uncharacterized protein (TIGR01777 family)
MGKKVVIAGGTGFLGSYLSRRFKDEGYEVIIIARSSGVKWSDQPGMINALNGAEMLINLAGKSVNCRYTEENKKLLLSSRVESTMALGDALKCCDQPPKIWFNASAATIYREEKDRANIESDTATGAGFSVELAKAWEKTFYSYQFKSTRQVALRISIILGKDGGVIPVFKNLVRFGLGGAQGSGKQMFSWIHIEDVFRLICFTRDHDQIAGPINCASPFPIDNIAFMKAFREAMHMPFGLPAYEWMIKIGAAVIGTETELVLKSRWVLPQKLLNEKFIFSYPNIQEALKEILL